MLYFPPKPTYLEYSLLTKMENPNDSLYFCPFSRAILNGTSKCKQAISTHIAERHNINCTQENQSIACQALIEATYLRAKFSLKAHTGIKALPNAKKTKLQIGLILGLKATLLCEPESQLDICVLRTKALENFGSLDRLPYEKIIPHISSCNPRKLRSH